MAEAESRARLTGVLNEVDDEIAGVNIPIEDCKLINRKPALIWKNIIHLSVIHIMAIYGVYLMFTSAKLATTISAYLFYLMGGIGITAGVHRLWAHRAYKAQWPLRVILMVFNTLAFQNSVIDWCKDHRVHHKYSETDADPHNARRGFFFSHVGWLLCHKLPEVIDKGRKIDVSDLYADPILQFQHSYYQILMPLICYVIPTAIPVYFWNESWTNAIFLNVLRLVFTLNCTWLVNSAAHYFGNKPYEKFIYPRQNLSVAILALGEGWHNFHHTFPWDYKTSELGEYTTNFTNAFIHFFAAIGWAYDLKSVSEEMVKKRIIRTGDGTHEIWGWGDKDQSKEDHENVTITYKKTN